MKKIYFLLAALLIISVSSCSKHKGNVNYRNNPEPLKTNAYIKLPLGAVKPAGWLKSQLEVQAEGLTGHLDEFWPDLVNSSWLGGEGEGWERGPYYLDGLVPLAYILDDKRLIEKVQKWIKPMIESARDSGWYGPARNKDRWPLAVSNKVLMQYFEATGDSSALNVLLGYFRYLHTAPPDWPAIDWRGVRAMENAVTGYWLYRQTGEEWIIETIKTIQETSADWTSYYEKYPWDSTAAANKTIPHNGTAEDKTAHGVNNAMAIKYPGLWYQQSGDDRYKNAVYEGIRKYDLNHGQAGGRFSCDEHLSGKGPNQGTELCTVVEYMFSLEKLFEIFGDSRFSDRLELLTYNSLPGTTTPDFWAHQYDQQANQVLVSAAKRDWSSNGDYSNIYGLMPNFGCCLANMHQGWPKFVESLWMATNDNGLVAVAYGPSVVKAKVADGADITISEETDYPFNGLITFTIDTDKPVRFPIELRIPAWADSVTVEYRGKSFVRKGEDLIRLNEKWKDGERITLQVPMNIRYERRYNNSASLMRGPLYFSLRIAREYKSVKINYDNYGYKGSTDWEITPKSPWNYGLLLDERNPLRGINITENPLGRLAFADKDDMVWSEDSSKYVLYQNDAPVVIKTRGIRIPEWTMKNNSADVPPVSPVAPQGDPEVIELVPYGCTRLRITEFPVMDVTLMEEVIK